MKKPILRALAAFVLLALVALLGLGCRHVDPRTYVMGAVSCEPQKGDKACATCVRASCCAQYHACANDAPCPCWLAARERVMPPDDALRLCGPQNAAYHALSACIDRCPACPAEDALARHPLLGKSAPEIDADVLGGEGPKTIQAARGKVALVDFWATWCGPCKESFPHYQALVDRFRGEVVVLALSVDDPESVKTDKLLEFAKDTHVRFSILWDKHQKTAAQYKRPPALPATFVLDRSGVIRHVNTNRGRERLIAEVEKLVAERADQLGGETRTDQPNGGPP